MKLINNKLLFSNNNKIINYKYRINSNKMIYNRLKSIEINF